jgi:PAS domain S-box-containing protein
MGLDTATGLNRWVKSAEAKTLQAGRFSIGPRLILGFAVIIFLMLAADAVVLWQFHLVRTEAERLNGIDQKLVAVLRVHTSLTAFHDRLEALVDSQDAGRLVTEAGPLRTAVLEDNRRAMSALSLAPFDLQRDPTILPTLRAVQSALPSQLEAITTLATSGDWRAVRLRLANQVTPLKSLTSALVETVDHEVGEEQAQTVRNIRRVQRLVFLVVPLTAVFTLLIAATLGLGITRSITQPLARLVEGSKALARGEFQHEVSVTGRDELAHLGRVFNDTARRLQDLYATLQQSEDRLRLVIDTIPAHVWSTRPDGCVDFVNRRWLETTGLAMEDALDWDWGWVVHPDDLARYVDQWRAALAAGRPMESEARLRRADGQYRWWLIRNVPLRDEAGNIVKWYGTAIDIEDRKQAEEALRQSEEQWRDVFENNPTMYFMVDAAGTVIAVNPFGAEQLGYKADELVGQPVLDVFHDSDREAVRRYVALCLEQLGRAQSWEARKVRKDGTVLRVRETAKAVPRVNGPLVLIACEDITEHKRAEEKIREQELELRQILDSTPLHVAVLGPDHRHIYVNQAALDYHGITLEEWRSFDRLSLDELRSSGPHTFLHPDDRERMHTEALSSFLSGSPHEIEGRLRRKDGKYRWFLFHYNPMRDEQGRITRWYVAGTDIEDRRQDEEALRQAQADLAHINRVTTMGELTVSVAHEVNQPIAAAVTNANTCIRWLAADPPNLEEARSAAMRIVKDGRRAGEIIGRIRLLFKKGTHPDALERKLVDVNEVIREMIVLLRSEAMRYNISVRTELAEDLPQVKGDYVQLQQVLMNLMINSIDAMKDVDGTRELAIKSQRAEDEQLLVSVSDTGVGLPPQHADEIFNAFFTTKPHGTGMGLRISRSVIDSHGGRLWAAGNFPRGASFYFTLPTRGT